MDFPSIEGLAAADEPSKKKSKTGGFQAMGLSRNVFQGVMKMGFKVPTPIQRKAIPHMLAGRDVVAMGRTGSGKTAAFVIPLLEKLKERSTTSGIRGVIISPTRELTIQTYSVCCQLGRFTGIRFCSLIGGSSMEQQFEALSENPDVLIATPGRLMHHLAEVKFSLRQVQLCVFDEADRLFELGFAFQLREILRKLPDSRQTALFSATLPAVLVEFTRAGLNDPAIVRLDVDTKVSDKLGMTIMGIRKEQKASALVYLLKTIIPSTEQTIVFVATRHHVEFVHSLLEASGVSSTMIYGQLNSTARKINMAKFKAKKSMVLVVTDLAARGIDIPLLDNVVNYDFADRAKIFVHRVGRVARAGRSGMAYSLVSPDEVPYLLDLLLFLGGRKLTMDPTQAGSATNPDTVHYGGFPTNLIREEAESVAQTIRDHHLLEMQRVMDRAYKMYYKTRQAASKASTARAKLLPALQPHPLLRESGAESTVIPEQEGAIDEYLQQIRSYKPSTTVMEIAGKECEAMKIKRKAHEWVIKKKEQEAEIQARFDLQQQLLSGTLASNPEEDSGGAKKVKKRKKSKAGSKSVAGLTSSSASSTSSAPSSPSDLLDSSCSSSAPPCEPSSLPSIDSSLSVGSGSAPKRKDKPRKPRRSGHARPDTMKTSDFKDPTFFISPDSSSAQDADKGLLVNTEAAHLEDHTLDMAGDDNESMMKAKKQRTWDTKKRKFVTNFVGGDPYKKQRNESGEVIVAGKHAKYEKWKQKQHKEIAMPDRITLDDDNGPGEDDGEPKPAGKKPKYGKSPRTGKKEFGKTSNEQGKNAKGGKAVKSELKSFHTIRKERLKKEKRVSYLKQVSAKKGGKSGGPRRGGSGGPRTGSGGPRTGSGGPRTGTHSRGKHK